MRFLRRLAVGLPLTLALAWAARALLDPDAAVAVLLFGTIASVVFALAQGGAGATTDGGSDSGGWDGSCASGGGDGGGDGGGGGGGE